MRLFLDQMIDSHVARRVRAEGHDVECASEKGMSRSDDIEILTYCVSSRRVLITLDEHFGDWAVLKLSRHPGVVRLKANPTSGRALGELLLPFLRRNKTRDFSNTLVIVKSSSVRWVVTAEGESTGNVGSS